MTPKTIEQWEQYIGTLEGDALRSKAKAANSVAFVRTLEEEGFSPADSMKVLGLFAQRFVATGQKPPSRYEGALVDFAQLVTPVLLPEPDAIAAE